MSIQNLNGIKYTEQTLTSAQQAQARQNIGAAAEGQSGPDYSVVEDMPGSLIFYTSAHGQPVQFNNGSYQQLLADTVITNGVYHYYPNKTRDFGIAGKTVVHIPIDPTDRTHTGYFRFYPNGTFDYLWLHTSYDWYGNSNNVILAEPFYQDLMCKDANIVINSYGSQQWNMYKINHTTSQNIQKFTVWTVTNTLWKEIWTGTGDVVMFDTDTYSKNAAEAPASLIGFTLYLPKNRYSSIVAQLKSDFGDSEVENYILPKVQTYDFVYSEGFKYRMVNSVPLTMTDANGDTISGDFVANNVTITPAV